MLEPDLLTGRVPIRPRRAIEKLSDTVIERIGEATPDKAGLMSQEDKKKLDGLGNIPEATTGSAGLLSAKDKEKLDRINLYNTIPLRNIVLEIDDSGIITSQNSIGPSMSEATYFHAIVYPNGSYSGSTTYNIGPYFSWLRKGAISYMLFENQSYSDINLVCIPTVGTDTIKHYAPKVIEVPSDSIIEISVYKITDFEVVVTASEHLDPVNGAL